MDSKNEPGPGLFGPVKRLLHTALAGVENRVELFLVEFREERVRIFQAFMLGCLAAMLAFMTLLMVTATLVVCFWDSARVLVLTILSALYLAATAAVVWQLKVRLRNWSDFSASLEELKKDRACFQDKN